MSLSLTGVITVIQDVQQVTDSFKKRGMFITSQQGQYENEYYFEATQERVALLDKVAVGQEVEVFFNIRCNEHNGRYFTNLQAWKIEAVTSQQPVQQPAPVQMPVASAPPMLEEADEDDLPF